ncbi:MAG: low molecular weight protein arginine phosphatase [Gemmatimonadota bacterium]|nr:low molecular weight protein arginine phosphatase [Gemmatimonadota bacterium]
MKILFVCSGNTCRSPMAEVLMGQAAVEHGLPGLSAESAGTGALEGEPASEGSYLVALEAGLDLSRHRARQLTPELVNAADLILTMSRSHLSRVETMGGGGKSWLLSEYGGQAGGTAEVSDPFGAVVEVYRQTFAQVESLVAGVAHRLSDRREP